MKNKLRTAIALGFAICSLAVQLACHAQSATQKLDKNSFDSLSHSSPQTGAVAELLASAKSEEPAPGSPAVAATSAAPAAPASAATPASVAVPLNNGAVIKELAEMKARIAQL